MTTAVSPRVGPVTISPMADSEPPAVAGAVPPDSSAVRVGDTERNAAVAALGEHMSTGRLDLDEFGVRSAKATNARTVGDLRQLFADLPAPHPPLPGNVSRPIAVGQPAVGTVQPAVGAAPATVDDRNRAQKLVAAAAGAAGIVALVLFFITDTWLWFLLIPLITSIASGVWGDSWKRPDRRR